MDITKAQETQQRMLAAEKKATPPWLTNDQADQIRKMKNLATDLNKVNTKYEFKCRPIIAYEIGGLHVPWNLQIIDIKDYDNTLTEPFKGSILIDDIYSDKTIKYNTKFIKGVKQKEKRVKKAEIESFKSSTFRGKINELRKKYSDDMSLIIREILLDTDNREEFLKYADKFLPYYTPKLQSVETKGKVDNTIRIEIKGIDMDKFKPEKLIDVTPIDNNNED